MCRENVNGFYCIQYKQIIAYITISVCDEREYVHCLVIVNYFKMVHTFDFSCKIFTSARERVNFKCHNLPNYRNRSLAHRFDKTDKMHDTHINVFVYVCESAVQCSFSLCICVSSCGKFCEIVCSK